MSTAYPVPELTFAGAADPARRGPALHQPLEGEDLERHRHPTGEDRWEGEAIRDDEVEITADQARRVQQLRDRAAELAARPGMSNAARRRRARA